MNKSLVAAAFAALSAPVISLTTEHKWERYDQSTHVPLWRDPSFANGFGGSQLQDIHLDHSDPTQPQTHSHPASPDDGPNGP